MYFYLAKCKEMRVTEDYTVLYIVPLQSNSHLELLLHLVGLEYNEGIIHIISNTFALYEVANT